MCRRGGYQLKAQIFHPRRRRRVEHLYDALLPRVRRGLDDDRVCSLP